MDTLYIYNAPYPHTYDNKQIVFEIFNFTHELDTSVKKQGLPGLCNVWLYPLLPCQIPNVTVPIRSCGEIGYGKLNHWPRVAYYWWPYKYSTSLATMLQMLGTAFVSCSIDDNTSDKRLGRARQRMPIVPNMRILQGFDAVSNTACLKLNFFGLVEPVWLGKSELGEDVNVYLERLPLPF